MIVPAVEQLHRARTAADWIRSRTDVRPSTGLILGTGLGHVIESIDVRASWPYDEIPEFSGSTVVSHEGRLTVGYLEGLPIVAMEGRLHLYEGHCALEATFPIRVMGELGIETLLISNAAGGMNPDYRKSDLVLIADHINAQGLNPLEGPNVDDWGPRFPDMSEAYDADLRRLATDVAGREGIKLHEGVYVAVVGPNLETRAEYAFLRQIGGDVVGMSTVPEVIVARHMGIRCLAISVVTDECVPETLQPVSIEDVLAAAAEAEPVVSRLVQCLAAELAKRAVGQ